MDLYHVIETTVVGMGYELVDIERAPRGLLRVTIDRFESESDICRIKVEDCERVSHQLTRVFEVEGVDYTRLEVSSPGLDRPLRKLEDYHRFSGQLIQLKLRQPIEGRRNFVGILQFKNEMGNLGEMSLLYSDDMLHQEVVTKRKSGKKAQHPTHELKFKYTDIEAAHLVPQLDFRSKK